MIERFSRGAFLGPALLFAVALAVRVAVMDSQGLWVDEVFSLAIATGHSLEHPAEVADISRGDFVEGTVPRPASEWKKYMDHGPRPCGVKDVIRAAWLSDTNPPLYYILLHYWTRVFGTDDRALKAFSIFCSLAVFPFIAILARRIGGRAAVLPACALYALAPACLYYSTEGRMYSLSWLWVVATADATLRWRVARKPVLPALGWIVFSAAGFYTHYFFLFVWVTFLVWFFCYPGRAVRARIALAAGAAVLLIAPWYLFVGGHMGAWRVTSGWLEMVPRGWWFPEVLVKAFLGHLSGQGIWGGGRRENVLILLFFFACFATFAIRWRTRAFAEKRGLIWMWFGAPVAGVVLLDAWQGTFALANYRYVCLGLPSAILIAATALAQWPARLRWAAVVLGVMLWAPRIEGIFHLYSRNLSPFRELGIELSEGVGPKGVVLANSIPSGVLAVARYSRDDLQIAAWVERLDRRKSEDLDRIVAGFHQAILVRAHEVWPNDRVENLLRESARFTRDYRKGAIHVLEFNLSEEPVPSESSSSGEPTRL